MIEIIHKTNDVAVIKRSDGTVVRVTDNATKIEQPNGAKVTVDKVRATLENSPHFIGNESRMTFFFEDTVQVNRLIRKGQLVEVYNVPGEHGPEGIYMVPLKLPDNPPCPECDVEKCDCQCNAE